jgi:hypothetical protein
MKKSEQTFYPFNYEYKKLIENNKAVVSVEEMGHLCGYCALLKTSVPEAWWGHYGADGLQFLKIHGGITYCNVEGDYVVFGFDCAHAYDEQNPNLKDPAYVMELTKTMERLLNAYAARIDEWRKANFKTKCAIIDEINEGIDEEMGFGALIDVMSGAPFGEPLQKESEEEPQVKIIEEPVKVKPGSRFDDIIE